MIKQYLSNTNEIATVLILPKNLELNKAQICSGREQYSCSYVSPPLLSFFNFSTVRLRVGPACRAVDRKATSSSSRKAKNFQCSAGAKQFPNHA